MEMYSQPNLLVTLCIEYIISSKDSFGNFLRFGWNSGEVARCLQATPLGT